MSTIIQEGHAEARFLSPEDQLVVASFGAMNDTEYDSDFGEEVRKQIEECPCADEDVDVSYIAELGYN